MNKLVRKNAHSKQANVLNVQLAKSNAFINQDYKNLEDNYLIIFNLSFQYKDRQVKKDLLW